MWIIADYTPALVNAAAWRSQGTITLELNNGVQRGPDSYVQVHARGAGLKIRAHARFNNLEVKDIRAVLVAFGGESMRIVDGGVSAAVPVRPYPASPPRT